MSGKKKTHPDIKPWFSAKADCRERRFIQVGNTLLLSPAFRKLSCGAQQLYLCMGMESGRRRGFTFPQSAAKKYGFAPTRFWRYVAELERERSIKVYSGKCARCPNRKGNCMKILTGYANLEKSGLRAYQNLFQHGAKKSK